MLALSLVASAIGCGSAGPSGPTGDGPDNLDAAVASVATTDGSVDGLADPGAAGAPRVPCADDPSAIIEGRDSYVCGSCGGDVIFPLICSGGYLACAKTYPSGGGGTMNVPSSMVVVNIHDAESKTGQCAYLAPYAYPGFMLTDPQTLSTARSPSLPLTLKTLSSVYSLSGFTTILTDRSAGEQAIRSLVVLTDMRTGEVVPYSIGDPVRDVSTSVETLALTPIAPLAANGWYRVTVFPGESQSLVSCHTFGRSTSGWLTAPQTTDFYTYSRPMVSDIFVPYKDGGKGYIQFDFTETLVAADLAAQATPVVLVDGVVMSGCLAPYPCSGLNYSSASYLRLDLQTVPQSFGEISLHIPHAIQSVQGGAVSAGVAGNPSATIDGEWAVYTFKASDMVLTDNNLVKRWYYSGP